MHKGSPKSARGHYSVTCTLYITIIVNSCSGKGAGNMAGLQRKGGRVERDQGKVAPKGEQGKVVPEVAETWNDFFQSGCSDHLCVNLIF
jgi:hypothetical protein